MSKLLIANWKLNPITLKEAVKLARAIDKKGTVICPPFIFLSEVKKILKHASLGAQDVFWEDKGAYTGEVSPTMLKNLGVKYVIIGHSERRRSLHETDEMINKKVLAALKAGLRVILCVGEPWSIRKKGLAAAKNFVRNQLRLDLKNLSSVIGHQSSVIVAYEPVWAIGTGRADKPAETVEMAKFIKQTFLVVCRMPARRSLGAGGSHVAVLYGGSVNSQNAAKFLQLKEIAGALVGGASLKADEFKKIISATRKIRISPELPER